jgi:hypothetical protein
MWPEIDHLPGDVARNPGAAQPLPCLIAGIVGAQSGMGSRLRAGEVMAAIMPRRFGNSRLTAFAWSTRVNPMARIGHLFDARHSKGAIGNLFG